MSHFRKDWQAAQAVKQVQAGFKPKGLSLVMWDCYRPARAVQDFLNWTKNRDDRMKIEFFPRVDKAQLFSRGYLATRSRHSRGSTVDLAIIPLKETSVPQYRAGTRLVSCFAPKGDRFEDGTLDFGTGQDCLDVTASFTNQDVGKVARDNRGLLRDAMISAGFRPYEKEW